MFPSTKTLKLPPAALTLSVLLGCAPATHGRSTSMSIASSADWKACEHRVPAEVCVRCHPKRIPAYKERGDWCPEHDRPESQCLECSPDLDFSPPEPPPAGADIRDVGRPGADVPALEPLVVTGKVTVFDFHAAWCPPCRKVDEHLYPIAARRADLAIRKIDVESWDTPVAERWLRNVKELPWIVVYDRNGRRVGGIAGAKLDAIDRMLREASR